MRGRGGLIEHLRWNWVVLFVEEGEKGERKEEKERNEGKLYKWKGRTSQANRSPISH